MLKGPILHLGVLVYVGLSLDLSRDARLDLNGYFNSSILKRVTQLVQAKLEGGFCVRAEVCSHLEDGDVRGSPGP